MRYALGVALLIGLLPLTAALVRTPNVGPAANQEAPEPSPKAMNLYAVQCSPCHGERGRGDGTAARFLDPAPRDFRKGPFKLVTTANGVASGDDLLEVISIGIPGTAMISFDYLTGPERSDLVGVIEWFRKEGLRELFKDEIRDAAELAAAVEDAARPGKALWPTSETPDTVDSKARGRIHFRKMCASCHGPLGRGDGVVPRREDEPPPPKPRDLSRGILKGGSSARELAYRIRAGMPGTPMPSVPESQLEDDGLWDLVHYLRTIIPPEAQWLGLTSRATIQVPRIEGTLPVDQADPRFLAAPPTHVALAPFRAEEATVPGLLVRVVHDGEHVIVRAEVSDSTRDVPAGDHRTPPDGLAIRVTRAPHAPVLPIPGQPLPLDRAFWLAGTMPPEEDGIFDHVEPRFRNPDSLCKSPIAPEKVGTAQFRDGFWTVVMAIRPDRAGRINAKESMLLSFASFDGSLRRGPLPTAFSAWQVLEFQESR